MTTARMGSSPTPWHPVPTASAHNAGAPPCPQHRRSGPAGCLCLRARSSSRVCGNVLIRTARSPRGSNGEGMGGRGPEESRDVLPRPGSAHQAAPAQGCAGLPPVDPPPQQQHASPDLPVKASTAHGAAWHSPPPTPSRSRAPGRHPAHPTGIHQGARSEPQPGGSKESAAAKWSARGRGADAGEGAEPGLRGWGLRAGQIFKQIFNTTRILLGGSASLGLHKFS